jgi:hypothetical protein
MAWVILILMSCVLSTKQFENDSTRRCCTPAQATWCGQIQSYINSPALATYFVRLHSIMH